MLGLLRSPLFEELPPDEGGPLSLTHAHRACELPGWKYCLGTPVQSLFMPPLQQKTRSSGKSIQGNYIINSIFLCFNNLNTINQQVLYLFSEHQIRLLTPTFVSELHGGNLFKSSSSSFCFCLACSKRFSNSSIAAVGLPFSS